MLNRIILPNNSSSSPTSSGKEVKKNLAQASVGLNSGVKDKFLKILHQRMEGNKSQYKSQNRQHEDSYKLQDPQLQDSSNQSLKRASFSRRGDASSLNVSLQDIFSDFGKKTNQDMNRTIAQLDKSNNKSHIVRISSRSMPARVTFSKVPSLPMDQVKDQVKTLEDVRYVAMQHGLNPSHPKLVRSSVPPLINRNDSRNPPSQSSLGFSNHASISQDSNPSTELLAKALQTSGSSTPKPLSLSKNSREASPLQNLGKFSLLPKSEVVLPSFKELEKISPIIFFSGKTRLRANFSSLIPSRSSPLSFPNKAQNNKTQSAPSNTWILSPSRSLQPLLYRPSPMRDPSPALIFSDTKMQILEGISSKPSSPKILAPVSNNAHPSFLLLNTLQTPVQNLTLATDFISSFTGQIKESIKNFKPPLTRLTLSLHPRELGKIELSITQRGNDLQVSITSNTQAISLLAQNQADLRASLQNLGFSQVDMTFSQKENSQGEGGSQKGKQKRNKNSLDAYEEIGGLTQEVFHRLDLFLPKYV